MNLPSEKARELVEKFKGLVWSSDTYSDYNPAIELENGKQCAHILCDEMISSYRQWTSIDASVDYYQDVKTEIDKIN